MWTNDNTIAVDGYQICFDEFRSMVNSHMKHAEELVLQKLFQGIDPILMGFNVTETTQVHDRFSETYHGYSFLTDGDNPFPDMKLNLIRGFFKHRPGYLVKGIHTREDGQLAITWWDPDCDGWLRTYDECMECLLSLVHIVGGQPARGVETCVMKLINGLHRVRGVYYLRPGMILFLLLYGKMSHTGKDTAVAHAVPWALGRLYLMVVALARPLAGLLFERRLGPIARTIVESSAFTQKGEETTSKQLSDSIRQLFQKNLGANIGIGAYRHFVAGVQRKKMPEAYASIMRAIAVVDAQAGHTTETAFDHYAIDPQELHLLNETTVLKSIHCSLRWASILFPDSVLMDSERRTAGAKTEAEAGRLLTLGDEFEIAHSTSWDPLITAVEALLQKPSFLESVGRILNAGLASGLNRGSESRTMEWINPAPRRSFAVEPKHLVLLRRFQNDPEAHWRSKTQSQAIAMVLSRSTSCLIIMPTGAGKSINFGPLALIETGSTVVVFPLKAVMLDQIQSSKRRQETLAAVWGGSQPSVELLEWTSDPNLPLTSRSPNAVYAVTVETFGSQAFKIWMLSRIAERSLNRVIFDECHVALISRRYRSSMWSLTEMTQLAVPIVGLTATMPPSLEEQMRLMLGEPQWLVLREPTQRPNIEYHIARYGTEALAERALERHVRHLEKQLQPGEGIMIICRTFEHVLKLGERLGALVYDREKPTETLGKSLKLWTSGQLRTIVGTTALGTGVHHNHCRVVIHFLDPYGVIDYVQESGRAGRDGKPALSMVFCSLPHPELKAAEPAGYQVLMELLDGVGCIRWVVSSWIDGRDMATTCSGGAGFRFCGRCQQAFSKAVLRQGLALAGPDVPNCGSKAPLDGDAWVVREIPREPESSKLRIEDGRDTITGVLEPDTKSIANVDALAIEMDWETSALEVAGPSTQTSSTWITLSDPSSLPSSSTTSASLSASSSGSFPRATPSQAPSIPSRTPYNNSDRLQLLNLQASRPQPVGQAVLDDATEARKRAKQARDPLYPSTEINPAQPFSTRALMKGKKFMLEHCPFCIGIGATHTGHLLNTCSHPAKYRSFSMDGFLFKGQSWMQARLSGGKRKFGGQENLCWLCLWPLGSFFEHPVRSRNEAASKYCTLEDVLKQMAWALVTDEVRRVAMRDYFSLTEELEMASGTNYAQWLMTTHRSF
ncbi:ATP-dependent DNA helicase tlh1 [Rhizoctonia solani]|uniref:DNA 3'-5' helicase n=1 Tax=Rhizoctonia solani TaxID=456999 RepID=A0A0K6FSP8_9AGAM|nr:ATP-dependent DNA helicase tlh1 [Rhizoctonia solani]